MNYCLKYQIKWKCQKLQRIKTDVSETNITIYILYSENFKLYIYYEHFACFIINATTTIILFFFPSPSTFLLVLLPSPPLHLSLPHSISPLYLHFLFCIFIIIYYSQSSQNKIAEVQPIVNIFHTSTF